MQSGLTRWERELIERLNDQLSKGVSYEAEFRIIGRILRVQHWARQRIALETRMAERVRAASHAWLSENRSQLTPVSGRVDASVPA